MTQQADQSDYSPIILASTAESVVLRDSVNNELALTGDGAPTITLTNPEEDLVRGLEDHPHCRLVVLVSQADTVLPAGAAFTSLKPPLIAAISATASRAPVLPTLLFVGRPMLEFSLPPALENQVALKQIDSVSSTDLKDLFDISQTSKHLPTITDNTSTPFPDVRVPNRTRQTHNLPPATYLTFIDRKQLHKAETSLTRDTPITSLIGFGGVGKSSIAREIGQRTLNDANRLNFQAIVWASDKADPGSTTLSRILDQIADNLDYPGLKLLALDDKIDRCRSLCREIPVLLIVDNFESIQDSGLCDWLRELPHPSRALVTSREVPPAFAGVQAIVRVSGFESEDAPQFASQVMEKLGVEEMTLPASSISAICDAAGGNAKAIEVAFGLLLSGHKTSEVIKLLTNGADDLFSDLFLKSWDSLDDTGRSALFAIVLLPFGAATDLLAQAVPSGRGALAASLEHLRRMALVDQSIIHDPTTNDDLVVFSLNPLVGAFVRSRAKTNQPVWDTLKTNAASALRSLTGQVGFCPAEIHRLDRLDRPGVLRNIESTITWCLDDGRFDDVITMARDVRYYYYVRGIWSPDPNLNLVRASAARTIGDESEELDALLYYCNIAAKQEDIAAFEEQRERLGLLISHVPEGSDFRRQFAHVSALFALAKGDTAEAIALWTTNLLPPGLTPADESANMRWLGIAYFRDGDFDQARSLLESAIKHDIAAGFGRAVLASRLQLIRIDVTSCELGMTTSHANRVGKLAHIRGQLAVVQSSLHDVNDRLYVAEWLELSGRAALINDDSSGVDQLKLAREHYDRMGMVSREREIAERIARNR